LPWKSIKCYIFRVRALFNQHIISLSVVCVDLPYFFTFSHKLHRLRTNVIKHKICILIFCTKLCETFLILRRNERDIIITVHRSSCKVPVISAVLHRHINFMNIFSKTFQISFMKTARWESRCSLQKNGRTSERSRVD